MEPGEYLTNVLSSNAFASINYEYFEPQTLPAGTAKKYLQRLESGWRQEGRLVFCDPFKDGVWIFQSSSGASNNAAIRDVDSSHLADAHGIGLLQRDRGTYEPASLARSKQAISNNMSTPSSSSSPSSSLDSAIRNAQALNGRAVQSNSALGIVAEPPTPSPGTKSSTGTDAPTSMKDIHEYFISAVLRSIVYFLCHDYGFVPLNSRTLILTPLKPLVKGQSINKPPQVSSSIELATLDISLTSLGTLVLKAYSDLAPGLQTLLSTACPSSFPSKLVLGAPLWLAPGGNAAKFYSHADEQNLPMSLSLSQIQSTPANQRPNGTGPLTIKAWQSKCLEWLSTKGLDSSALEEGGWLFVQVLGSQSTYFNGEFQGLPMLEELAVIPWPALLCFQTSSPGARSLESSNSGSTGPRDALSFAQDWFTTKDERATAISKRQKERQAAETLSQEQADVEARALQSITYSPAALRRSSNAGAMYPTPPDAPHHPVGATPTFDGTVSTPGIPPPFASLEPGTTVQTSSGDVDLWGSASKKERNNSAVQFNDNENDNANMFGEIGGDIFGTDDITDADFSFFDEPDAIQPSEQLESPSSASLPAPQEATSLAPEPNIPSITAPDASNAIDLMLNIDASHVQTDELPQPSAKSPAIEPPKEEVEPTGLGAVVTPNRSLPTSVDLIFNKETVFKQLVKGSSGETEQTLPRRASLFSRVDFSDALLSVNEKYGANGQFNFTTKPGTKQDLGPPELPKTHYLSSRRKVSEGRQDFGSLARILIEKEDASPVHPAEPMDYLIDSDGASQVSEQDDTSRTTDDLCAVPNLSMKRKWETDGDEDMTSTFDALAMELDYPASTPQSISGSQLPLLEADPADWSLATYFTSLEPDVQSNALTDLERIATAQILADQAVSGTLQLPNVHGVETASGLSTPFTTRELMFSITKAANLCLGETQSCNMRSYLGVQGIPVLNPGLRLPPRPIVPRPPGNVDAAKPNNPFQIAPPHLEVRRSESKLSVLPAAITFWENLGLGPARGNKDVNSVCIYPNLDGVAAYADVFLDQMRSVYECSRLGSHDKLISKDLFNGSMPYNVEATQPSKFHQLSGLRDVASRLSRVLSSAPVDEKNFVIYFVYPTEDGSLLVHICSAFQHLFNLYRKALAERRATTTNELVLQLIPLNYISSPTSLAAPLPSDYFRLAMEVYDRCVDFNSSSSTAAIMLEQPLPKSIEFKLNPNPSASLLQENTCLHVAYAQSIDDRWITATWTDNRGTQQMTASYCLGRKNESLSMPFSEVANEIWETTLDYISSKKIHWRIIIARVGVMDPTEMDFWISLASTESDAYVNLTLVTVQTDPSLRLLPPSVILSPNGHTANSVVTPVSTPQALHTSIVSPGDAATPTRDNASATTLVDGPVEPDGDSRLIDSTDQSWGAVLSHRLNNSNSLMELNPALISGYLIKRGGVNSDDPPIVMEVNIVYSEVVGNPRTFHEGLLREILGYYRGLGTLARVRGLVDPVLDIRPWHIAAAEKAVKALYMLM